MNNKTGIFFVCTYTNRPMKESQLHVLYPYLYPYLCLDLLWQCAVSRYFSVKLNSAPSEVKKFSYLNLLPTFYGVDPLIYGFIVFQEGKDLPESALVIFS